MPVMDTDQSSRQSLLEDVHSVALGCFTDRDGCVKKENDVCVSDYRLGEVAEKGQAGAFFKMTLREALQLQHTEVLAVVRAGQSCAKTLGIRDCCGVVAGLP